MSENALADLRTHWQIGETMVRWPEGFESRRRGV